MPARAPTLDIALAPPTVPGVAARIGIDTGGTFTDVVRLLPRGLLVHKLPSTPADPARAVLQGLAAVRRQHDEPVDVVHGTTVGLNAVLQGALPRTAFVTNRGFVDLIEIGRGERNDLYALEPDRPAPPVPRALRLPVDCRRGPDGEVVRRLSERDVAHVVRKLVRLRPQAVAIGLLHSPADPADEQRLAAAIAAALPRAAITCSAELWPAAGEYERFCAAILNAAITPLVGSYTGRLAAGMGPGSLRLLRSSLGIMPPAEAARFPARAMFSGPAGGVLATSLLARELGFDAAAAFDMGGTSTDVCLVAGGERITDRGRIAGLPLPLPAAAVHTVGCGGGSIAYRDRGGALRVGPQSAGADPGPACYGKGDAPTVTDAHMALGHLGPETLLGGAFPVDPDRSVRAIERLARQLGMRPQQTAEGILAIADVHMVRALMVATVERGIDPAAMPLVAYGGAGGLHAAALATALGMPCAIVPAHPGAFSALGLALAGESIERIQPLQDRLWPRTERDLRAQARKLCQEARRQLGAARGTAYAEVLLRYAGQGDGLRLRLGARGLRPHFLAAHRSRFGFAPEDVPIEVVQLMARAEQHARRLPPVDPAPAGARPERKRRRALLGPALHHVIQRSELRIGDFVQGPCLIEETTAVTRVAPHTRVEVLSHALKLCNSPR